jgi:hypothetical protein
MAEDPKGSLNRRQTILITLSGISLALSFCLGYAPGVADKWVYLTSLVSLLLFSWSLWDITHSRMLSMLQKLDEHITAVNVTLALDESSKSVKALVKHAQKYPIIKEYLTWFIGRHKTSLILPSQGIIEALDADYFGFAELIFRQAISSIRSTSVVDPHWYDSNQ